MEPNGDKGRAAPGNRSHLVAVGQAGRKTSAKKSHRFWGYAPSNGNSENNFDVRVGLYANPQPVAHSLWIDDVRWETKREVVDLGMNPVKLR